MKKILLLLTILISINGLAQIEKPITKGNLILSGGGTIQFQKDKFDSNTGTATSSHYYISLNPGFGYFFADHFAAGLTVPIYYNGTTNNKFYTFGIGPMLRYYFNNGFFLKADASYSILHNLDSNASNENYLALSPGVGYAIFLNPKVSLEPAICYQFDNLNYNSTNTHKINSFRLEIKFTIFL